MFMFIHCSGFVSISVHLSTDRRQNASGSEGYKLLEMPEGKTSLFPPVKDSDGSAPPPNAFNLMVKMNHVTASPLLFILFEHQCAVANSTVF